MGIFFSGGFMKVYDLNNNFNDVTESFELGKSIYWFVIDVKELSFLKNILLFDDDCLEECKSYKLCSKITFLKGYIFLTLDVLEYAQNIVEPKELNLFLSKDYMVTVIKEKIPIIDELITDLESSKNCFKLKDTPRASLLLYYIFDRLIVKNYEVISALESDADKIEISILKSPKREQINHLITLRRQVYKIRKYLNPLRYIGDSLLSNDNLIIEKDCIGQFVVLNNKISKLMLALESLMQSLALVREAFESEIANKTNELMKAFTVVATIFLPLNLLTSMHGMNLKHIPLVGVEYGYYYMVIIMVSIGTVLLCYFKRKKWL